MLNWLKWLIARKEMQELDRWRVQWEVHRRWLAEFRDAADALDHLRQEVSGDYQRPIVAIRNGMRERAAAQKGGA